MTIEDIAEIIYHASEIQNITGKELNKELEYYYNEPIAKDCIELLRRDTAYKNRK